VDAPLQVDMSCHEMVWKLDPNKLWQKTSKKKM